MGGLTLDLRPGAGLGAFNLGTIHISLRFSSSPVVNFGSALWVYEGEEF
jgi:hypothetical protein